MKCASCFHDEANHKPLEGVPGFHICTGSLDCRCEHYEVQMLHDFAARVEEEKYKRKKIYDRVKWILQQIPQTRNAGEKTFAKIYNEIWYGFKIRKDGTSLTTEEWKRLPNQDTVNREKRRVKADYPELQTYNKEVLMEQTAIYQALMEMALN